MSDNKRIDQRLKEIIAEAVNSVGVSEEILSKDISLEHPVSEEHGDYSTNIALRLAKQTGKNPHEIAELLIKKLTAESKNDERVWGKVEVAGPGFINFYISKESLVDFTGVIISEGDEFGGSQIGKGKTMVIDYSAPNIAKPFGIGHLRSTIIGQAIYNLYKFSGYLSIGDNHLGDWGTQFGKLLYMISEKGQSDFTIDDLEKWYVEFHQMAETNANLDDEARKWFKKLEEGDKRAHDLWKKCVEISMKEFNRIYELLGVKIDFAYGESTYENLMLTVIAEAKKKKIARESDGAWVIDIPGLKTPLILVKSDGGTTYATRDLATLKFRQEKWHPDIVIYEVGAEQALHFVQVFAAARLLGYAEKNEVLIHTKHGLYRWEHGKMSTRKGDTIKLEDILLEAISRAEKLGSKETAKEVGIGAVKYFDLSHNVTSDIIFNWEKMFSLSGDSGPYLQYTFARAKSVLAKGKTSTHDRSAGDLSAEEISILRYLYRFPEVVEQAAKTFSPNLVCTFLFELSKRFNNFYNNQQVLGSESEGFRLQLVEATSVVLKNGLELLGIKALEKM